MSAQPTQTDLQPTPRDSGEFFTQIALQNELLTLEQSEVCLARKQELQESGDAADMEEIVVGLGFMNREQAALVTRGKNYMKARQEDLLLSKVLRLNNVADESDINYALTLQDALYQHEEDEGVTRLLDLLIEDKVIDERFVPSLQKALKSIQAALASGESVPDDPDIEYEVTDEVKENDTAAQDAVSEETALPSTTRFSTSTDTSAPVSPSPVSEREEEDQKLFEESQNDAPKLVCSRLMDDDKTRQKKVRDLLTPGGPKKVIRRAHQRFEVKEATVHWTGDSLFSSVDLFERPSPMVNLSLGGLGMVTRRPIAIGEKLKLVVHIPALTDDLEVRVEVRNCETIDKYTQHYQVGVKFLKLKENVRREIHRLAKDPTLRYKGKLKRYSRGSEDA
jgi:Tfp pilus assembly protein PilZ